MKCVSTRRIVQAEVSELRAQLAEMPVKVHQPTETSFDVSWLESVTTELNENVQERINLHKAICELQDIRKSFLDRMGQVQCYLSRSS